MCKYTYNPERSYPKGTPFTYLISWTDLNISYYGVRYAKNGHPNDLWTKYFTSSNHVKNFRELNGNPDVIKIDYVYDTKDEARENEEYFLKEHNCAMSQLWLNKMNGGKNFCVTKESIIKTANGNRGKKRSLISRQKQSIATLGKKKSPEHCKNISKGKSGRKQSEEHRKKNGASRKGKPGQKHTEDEKLKISESKKGKFLINNGEIQFYVFAEQAEILYNFGFNIGQIGKQ